MNLTPKTGLELLISVLDGLEIRYAIAGSVASSVHGVPEPLSTVEIVADIRQEHVSEFVRLTADSSIRTKRQFAMPFRGDVSSI
jgi:hypothetical protein